MNYSEFMDCLFDWCVCVLEVAAVYTGMIYNEINIRIFAIIELLVFVWICYDIRLFRQRIKQMERSQTWH